MTLQTTTIAGLTLSFIDEQEFTDLYNEIFKVNQYRFSTRAASPYIVDCGANIGLSVLYFKKLYPQAKIVAFEPNPDTFELLELNIRQNNVSDVKLVNAALSDSQGEMDFYISKDDFSLRRCSDTGIKNASFGHSNCKTIKVPTVQLSSYIKQEVDMLKMDIEGMEEMVLKEIEDKLGLVKEIRMEFHGCAANEANNLDRIIAILNRNKFKYALERDRKVISIKRARQELERTEPYLLMIYTHRRQSSLWWQSWFTPKALRVQNRLRAMMPHSAQRASHSSL